MKRLFYGRQLTINIAAASKRSHDPPSALVICKEKVWEEADG